MLPTTTLPKIKSETHSHYEAKIVFLVLAPVTAYLLYSLIVLLLAIGDELTRTLAGGSGVFGSDTIGIGSLIIAWTVIAANGFLVARYTPLGWIALLALVITFYLATTNGNFIVMALMTYAVLQAFYIGCNRFWHTLV